MCGHVRQNHLGECVLGKGIKKTRGQLEFRRITYFCRNSTTLCEPFIRGMEISTLVGTIYELWYEGFTSLRSLLCYLRGTTIIDRAEFAIYSSTIERDIPVY